MGWAKRELLERQERECAECSTQAEGARTDVACGRCGNAIRLCAGCAADETRSELCDYCQHVMESDS